MTFLAPMLLALGLAIAIPLVLHLLQRHQGPRVVFPALRYLRRAEREHAMRIRLRQLLLLALRVLALALLAAAAARPFLPLAGPGHRPTSVVIVLDNAMSSGAVVDDRRVLDDLKEVAVGTLEAAGPDDRFWLIRAGEPWEPAATGEAGSVLDAVRRTGVAGGGSDVTGAVERAFSILSAEPAGRPREVHVLSDLRAGSLRPAAPAPDAPPVLVLAATPVAGNRAITDVEVGGGMDPRAGERSTMAVTVRRFGAPDGGEIEDTVDVRLILDGAVRAVGRAAGDAVVVLPFPALPPGTATGRVEMDPDAIATDSRRHFVVGVRRPPTVAATRSLPFLDEALAVLAEGGRIESAGAGAAEVVVAPGADGADAVRRGAAVLVLPPATPVGLPAANQALAAAGIPYRLAGPAAGTARLDPAGSGLEAALDRANLREVYALESTAEQPGETLLRLRTGEPWAVAGEVPDGGRYVVLGSPLTAEASDLPTSAALVPLLDRAINQWAVGTAERADYEPGAVVMLPPADSMLRPDGGSSAVTAGSAYRLTEPGLYRLVHGDTLVAAFAVNAPPSASDITPVARAALPDLLPGEDVRVVQPGGWTDAIYHQRLGREVTLMLVALALLVLLVEAAVAASGPRPRRRSEPDPSRSAGAAGTA